MCVGQNYQCSSRNICTYTCVFYVDNGYYTYMHTEYLKKKLIDVPPSLRDVFAANLDANLEGVPSWEQFGEKLLNMDATDLRQFQARDSPTKAILNKKVATDPSATLEDAFGALEAIGRKDVTELVLQKLGPISREEPLDKVTSSLSSLYFSQRLPLIHQTSSTDSEHGTARQSNPYSSHMPLNAYPQSTVLPKQHSLEQPSQSSTADSPAQIPG